MIFIKYSVIRSQWSKNKGRVFMKKKIVSLILTAAMAASMLAGCASSETSDTSATSSNGETSETSVGGANGRKKQHPLTAKT